MRELHETATPQHFRYLASSGAQAEPPADVADPSHGAGRRDKWCRCSAAGRHGADGLIIRCITTPTTHSVTLDVMAEPERPGSAGVSAWARTLSGSFGRTGRSSITRSYIAIPTNPGFQPGRRPATAMPLLRKIGIVGLGLIGDRRHRRAGAADLLVIAADNGTSRNGDAAARDRRRRRSDCLAECDLVVLAAREAEHRDSRRVTIGAPYRHDVGARSLTSFAAVFCLHGGHPLAGGRGGGLRTRGPILPRPAWLVRPATAGVVYSRAPYHQPSR